MKQIVIRAGSTLVESVPHPIIAPATELVKVAYSCISQGTELSGIKNSGLGTAAKIANTLREKPQAIQKAIELYMENGLSSVYSKHKSTIKPDMTAKPTGYSVELSQSILTSDDTI